MVLLAEATRPAQGRSLVLMLILWTLISSGDTS